MTKFISYLNINPNGKNKFQNNKYPKLAWCVYSPNRYHFFYLPLQITLGSIFTSESLLPREVFLSFNTQMNKTLLTQEGYQQLTKKLDDLKDKQSRLITQLEEVAQPDESGEDGLATQLKEELEVVNDQIDQITESLENSEIISGKTIQSTIVQVGSTVKIKIANTNTKTYNIVTHLEADPSQNKISDQSPLGQALLGKKMLDEIEIEAPVGKITYKIVSIS